MTDARGRSGNRATIEQLAQPILTLDPEQDWVGAFNALQTRGGEAVVRLCEHPSLHRRCAPDDLGVLLRVNLIRLLLHPAHRPSVSVNCLETGGDLLYLEPKVNGRTLGRTRYEDVSEIWRISDLYPAEVAGPLLATVDADADRRALLAYLDANAERLRLASRLEPYPSTVWSAFASGPADRWYYSPTRPHAARRVALHPAGFKAAAAPPGVLYDLPTVAYTRARAACLWLATRADEVLLGRLIGLLTHPDPIRRQNALFTLRRHVDPRIRSLMQQLEQPPERRSESRVIPVAAVDPR